MLNNGLQLLHVSSDRVQSIKGLVLLIAVALDVLSKRSGGPSLIGRFRRTSAPAEKAEVTPTAPAEESARPSSTTPN